MLDLVQISYDGLSYTYQYYPEGDQNAAGVVDVNTSTHEITITTLSSRDKYEKYAGHAWSRLNSYLQNGEFLEKDLVAWG